MQAALPENERVIQSIKGQLPHYHTRSMRQDFINMYGRLTPSTPPYVLRDIYKALTKDQCASCTTNQKEIDMHIKEALESEDADIIVDLREFNGRSTDRYKVFWEICETYLNECTAVHEHRHDSVVFMAKAISVRDLIIQVQQHCPDGTPIPSESWVYFNFFPQNPRETRFYCGRLGAKRMVQKRLMRKDHPDSHYAAALFRYEREFDIKNHTEWMFFAMMTSIKLNVVSQGFQSLLLNKVDK